MRCVIRYISMACLSFCMALISCKDGSSKENKEEAIVKDSQMQTGNLSLLNSLEKIKELSEFTAAIEKTKLSQTLKRPGPFTVFAPNNTAMKKLKTAVDEDRLSGILENHIVAGEIKSEDLKDGMILKTIGGSDLKVGFKNNQLFINGVTVINRDLLSDNGIIYIIDKVLMTKES